MESGTMALSINRNIMVYYIGQGYFVSHDTIDTIQDSIFQFCNLILK